MLVGDALRGILFRDPGNRLWAIGIFNKFLRVYEVWIQVFIFHLALTVIIFYFFESDNFGVNLG